MNKLLYLLIGGAVTGALVVRLFDKDARRPVKFDETDLAVACVCLLVIAAGLLFLTRTRLGRRWKASNDKRAHDEEDRLRTTPGKVRPPPWGL